MEKKHLRTLYVTYQCIYTLVSALLCIVYILHPKAENEKVQRSKPKKQKQNKQKADQANNKPARKKQKPIQ